MTAEDFENRFSNRVTLSAATLEDLAKVLPTAVTVAEDAMLEDVLEKHDSTARAVRQVVDDSTEALDEGDASGRK